VQRWQRNGIGIKSLLSGKVAYCRWRREIEDEFPFEGAVIDFRARKQKFFILEFGHVLI
jgi:hypothetical protein